MSTGGYYLTIPGLSANSTGLASYQYYIVQTESTEGLVKLATSGTSKILGVLQNDPAANEPAEVAFIGVVKVAAEASVSIGDWVTSSSTGRAKTTTTDTNMAVGRALQASSTAGNIIRIQMGCPPPCDY
jgi:hypothetical protein